MKVGVFCEDIDPQSGGASSLTRTILKELGEHRDTTEFVLLYFGKRRGKHSFSCGLNSIDLSMERTFSDAIKERLERIWVSKRKHSFFDRVAQKYGIDIIWFCYSVDVSISIPYIYTVWDLGHRVIPYFPEVSSNNEWVSREKMYKKMIPNASWVLAGNITGKKEIVNNYSISEERVKIASFPISTFCYGEEKKPSIDLPEVFFFYPAQFWAHKNHIVILYALEYLKREYKIEISVCFTGSDKGNKHYIEKVANHLSIDKQVIFTGFISDEEMKYMYTHARAMLFPSFLGPNNMPPIEAAYLGCPLILSDIAGHREQMQEAALYFNPRDEKELAECIMKMLDDDIREDLATKVKEYGRKFSEISYCEPVFEIIEEFKKYRRCWE